jgi:hypothetical protein
MEETTNHHYYIQSKNRLAGSNSSSDFNVIHHKYDDCHTYRTTKVIVPWTFYNVSANYNTISIVFSGTTKTTTIPIGQYDITTLPNAIATALTALGVGTFSVTVNPLTYIITITSTLNYQYNGLGSTINKIIGFDPTVLTANALSQVAPFIYNLSGPLYLDVISSSLTSGSSKIKDTQGSSSRLISRIPLSNFNFGSIISYSPVLNHSFTVDPLQSQNIDIQLLDDNYNVVNLNGSEWMLQIRLTTDKSNDPKNPSRHYNRHLDYLN